MAPSLSSAWSWPAPPLSMHRRSRGVGLTGEVTKVTKRVDQLADYQPEVLDTEDKGFLPSNLKEAKMPAPEL